MEGRKLSIHLAMVSIFGRMTGKHRYFCETDVFCRLVHQHVLSKVVMYLVFLPCLDIYFG